MTLPTEASTPQEVRSAMTQLGCPEEPGGYKDPGGFDWPEGYSRDDDFINAMKGVLWQSGVTQQSYEKIFPAFVTAQVETMNAQKQVMLDAGAAGRAKLEEDWGTAYPQKVKQAQAAMEHVFGDQYNELISLPLADGSLLGAHPLMVAKYADLANQMYGEGKNIGGQQGREVLTPAEAKAELDTLMRDQEFLDAWNDSNHVKHEWAVNRRSTLMAMQHPQPAGGEGQSVGLPVTGGAMVRGG